MTGIVNGFVKNWVVPPSDSHQYSDNFNLNIGVLVGLL